MAREVIEVITPSNLADLDSDAATKLSNIAENATGDQSEADIKTLFSWSTSPEDGATADQTGVEMQTSIVGLADADRVLVGSEPQSGEKQIYGIHRNAAGNLEMDAEDTAV